MDASGNVACTVKLGLENWVNQQTRTCLILIVFDNHGMGKGEEKPNVAEKGGSKGSGYEPNGGGLCESSAYDCSPLDFNLLSQKFFHTS